MRDADQRAEHDHDGRKIPHVGQPPCGDEAGCDGAGHLELRTASKAKGLRPLDPHQGTVVPWTPRWVRGRWGVSRRARAGGMAWAVGGDGTQKRPVPAHRPRHPAGPRPPRHPPTAPNQVKGSKGDALGGGPGGKAPWPCLLPHPTPPVLPNPPSPREVASRVVTSCQVARTTGARMAWAMRVPRVTVNAASPAFMTITWISPR